MKLHEKINLLRESQNISQEEIADKLGISQSAYSKIERGKTTISTDKLLTIAEILGITVGELVETDCQIIIMNHGNKDDSKNFILTTVSENNENIDVLKERIAGLEREKELLERENTLLRENNRLLNEKFSVNGL